MFRHLVGDTNVDSAIPVLPTGLIIPQIDIIIQFPRRLRPLLQVTPCGVLRRGLPVPNLL